MSAPVTAPAPAVARSAAERGYPLAMRPLDPDADAALVHAWVTAPRARFWQMEHATLDDVSAEYAAIAADPGREAWIGLHAGAPAFLVEAYDPADDPIGAHLDPRPGDRGMHLLVAPPAGDPLPGFTTAVMRHVVAHLLRDPAVERLVVEPDVRNTRIQRLNELVGFRPLRVVDLGAKHALLSVVTRDDALLHATPTDGHAMTFTHDRTRETHPEARPAAASRTAEPDPRVHSAPHLRPDVWAAATRHLVRKALAEFAHELLIAPERVDPELPAGAPRRPHDPRRWADYRVASADGRSAYAYRARVLELDHWDVDEASIRRTVDGQPVELDATDLVLDLRDRLGITDEVLPVYLDEIQSTLSAASFSRLRDVPDARGLLTASYAEVESTMDEGHPCFVATNGRIGFDLDDHDRYAPEAGADVRILWLAVHERLARFTAIEGLDREAFLDAELGASARARFRARMESLGIDPAERVLVPVHPWQWENVVTVTFAGLVARRDILLLGTGDDEYGAQQSIRTWANRTTPERCYVKTSLSILNMGFTRGLSPAYMAVTPAINDWVHALVTGDAEFDRLGFGVLREVAAVGVRDERVESALPPGHSHGKMLSALWRESPVPGLAEGERLMSMTSLLHVDAHGDTVLGALIDASGIGAAAWLRRWLDAYLVPLAHALIAHDLAFMPHGENVILVLRDHVVVRVLMKDIAEEVALFDMERELPEDVRRIRMEIPEEERTLTVFTDVMDGFLRFAAALLEDRDDLGPEGLWRVAAEALADHERAHPELAERFARFDLFAPSFDRSCLNRLQLRDNRRMVDLQAPVMQIHGSLRNPLAIHAGLRPRIG
ncbi:Aerobactin synthase [Clavibacter michiganensis subsp. michiganensis]|uniref:Lysine N-acyltransferase MbtK n=1 Tax=Clavibacter michiganensis subsp. michiganensis TaxID=33013 RepID=A0A251XIQ8_CLAMM|nr:GNAT family N-acetyltransferase [Clavibacter michiganensis]OUD86568.1 Aerobactin synthase [Clavibacter michiganensis subsp. michiganensis]OUE03311.1 Aerobactin synthase [Clavibacter michiganensis subsp. michiganensis]